MLRVMKIVFIGQKGIPAVVGGVERHAEELAVRLAEDANNEVIVYTRPWYTAKSLKRYQGVQLVSLPSLRTKHLDAISHTFLAVLHATIKERPDIIHLHAVGPALLTWLARLLRPQAKVVVTFHCLDRQHQKWGKVSKLMLWLGEWMAMNFAHEVIAVSKNLQQYAYELYGRKLVYIPNGVAEMTAPQASIITEQFGLQPNEYILMVARLVPHKGAHYLINAFKGIVTDKKLVIVGETAFTEAYGKELTALAANDPRIIFTGAQIGKTLAELYANAYCFVLPSQSEGLPLVLLEAAAYGLPVLASDIPANLEVISGLGLTFASGQVAALQTGLEKILRLPADELTQLGKRARSQILARYHWNDITNKTQLLYQTLLPSCQAPRLATQLKSAKFSQ